MELSVQIIAERRALVERVTAGQPVPVKKLIFELRCKKSTRSFNTTPGKLLSQSPGGWMTTRPCGCISTFQKRGVKSAQWAER